MSKASDATFAVNHAESKWQSAKGSLEDLRCIIVGQGAVAHVSGGGQCQLEGKRLTAPEAVQLGRWLLDTFGEPQEKFLP